MGFLAADGYLYNGPTGYHIGVGLAKYDLNHIEKFRDFIEADYKISEDRNAYYLRISNRVFCDNLKRHGIKERKSSKKYSMISFVPYEYRGSFIAGYFDGDGAIFSYIRRYKNNVKVHEDRYYRAQIDGNKRTLEDMRDFLLDNYNFVKLNIIKHSSIWRIMWNRRHDIEEFSKLYFKSKENLVRKKEVFNEFLQGRRTN